jgi:taurine dioxygenase
MQIQRVTGVLGAVVEGVRLRNADDDQIAELKQLLGRYQVLFLPGQDLSEEEQLAAAARFGELFYGDASREALSRIENSEAKAPSTDKWHADSTFLENPPSYAFLRADQIPPHGGDTMWVSLVAAYEALSAPMKQLAESLSASHIMSRDYLKSAADTFGAVPDVILQRRAQEHPLVIKDPLSGKKSLYLSPRYLEHLIGIEEAEGEAVLGVFNSLLDRPALQVRWKWTPNDLAIWDERATCHRGLSDHFWEGPQYRLMKQCLALGESPIRA